MSFSFCFWREVSNSWILNDIGRKFLLRNRKKLAKSVMKTFTCRSTFLYAGGVPWEGWVWCCGHHISPSWQHCQDSWQGKGKYSIIFYSILFYSILLKFYSILFYSILFYIIKFYSILLYCILLYSIPLYCIVFYYILFYSIIFYYIYFIIFYSIKFYSIILYSGIKSPDHRRERLRGWKGR